MGGGESKARAATERERQLELYARDRTFSAAEIGYNARRHCTDILGLLLYGVAFAAMMYVAATGFEKGDPIRLLYGVDRAGYVCGQDYAGNVPPEFNLTDGNGTALKWTQMKYLVYGLPSPETCAKRLAADDPPSCADLITNALDMGICWYECPRAGTHVTWYDGTDQKDGVDVGLNMVFDTKPTLHRCFPLEPDAVINSFNERFGIVGTATAELELVYSARWTLLLCLFVAVVLSFLWLRVLQCTVKPVVFVSMALLWVFSAVLVYFCYKSYDKAAPGADQRLWMVFLILTGAWAALYTCLVVFFCRSVNIACDCIEEAARIPLSLPGMTAVPPVITLCLIPIAIFHVVVWMYLETSGEFEPRTIDDYANVTDPTGAIGAASKVTVQVSSDPQYAVYAKIYNIFMFLWSMNFWISCGYMTVAFCGVFWYWSTPGDNKSPQGGVSTALCWVFRYHMGTIMLGSLLVAVLQTIRFLLGLFEERMRQLKESSTVQCVLACVQCCLACFERLIKFINNNAYIMTCMCSDNFCNGARRAIWLLIKQASAVMAVNVIAGWVIFFGKLQIVTASLLIGWQLLTNGVLVEGERSDELEDNVTALIVIAIVAYVIVSVFVNVFATCVDVVMLSYAYDLDVNNGADRPYYLPKDLQRSLGARNEQSEMHYSKM